MGEVKSGSSYDYLQRIRYYTGWEYEYVYGSVGEMFEKLETGEIDLLPMVTYTDERAEKYSFTDGPYGMESIYLYVHKDDDSILDANTLNGKRVGVTAGTSHEARFYAMCRANQIDCDIIPYAYAEDLHNALTRREVDAIVDVRIIEDDAARSPWKSVQRFGMEPLHLAVSQNRPDILKELNAAQSQIFMSDELYGYKLLEQYYSGANFHNMSLTEEQKAYLENRGVLKVGFEP